MHNDFTLCDAEMQALFDVLRQVWRADTSFDPDGWSPANPAFGQCAVTALIVQEAFGGELLRGAYADGSHYWNRLPQGIEVDLTAEQFEARPTFDTTEPRSRVYVLSNPDTCARYEALRRRVDAITA